MSPGGSGGNQQLANLVVQFTLQGQQQLQQGLTALQQQTTQVQGAVSQLGQQMQVSLQQAASQTQKTTAAVIQLANATAHQTGEMKAAFERLTRAVGLFHFDYLNKADDRAKKTQEAKKPVEDLGGVFERLQTRVNIALGIGQAAIMGFVRQGLSLGTTGLMLQQRMERLALAISGLFRPEVQKITELVERLTTWLSRLSDRQREQVAHWIQAGAAALAMALVLPKVIAGITGAAAAIKGLGVAIGILEGSTGIGALIPLLGFAVQGLTLLAVGTDGGRAGLSRLWEATKPLTKALAQLGEKLHLGDLLEKMGDDFAVVISAVAKLVDWITKLVDKLNELSSDKFVEFIHGFARVAFGFGAIANGLRMLGHSAKLPPAPKDRTTDAYRSTGFSSVESIYEKIAQLTVGTRRPEERTADAAEQIARNTERAANAAEQQRNPVAVGA